MVGATRVVIKGSQISTFVARLVATFHCVESSQFDDTPKLSKRRKQLKADTYMLNLLGIQLSHSAFALQSCSTSLDTAPLNKLDSRLLP
jgi:hypothetical protein